MQIARVLTKSGAIAEQLRNEILHGTLHSGTQLEQDDVARRFGMSITPVREAFSVLEAEGLLELRPHRGVVVATLNYRDAEDLYELRRFLEVKAIRRAAENIDEAALSKLEQSNKDVETAARHPELHKFRELCGQFHGALVEATGSKVYSEITRSIIRLSLFFVPLDAPRIGQVVREHRAMIEALRRRDANKAALIMERHIAGSVRLLRRQKHSANRLVETSVKSKTESSRSTLANSSRSRRHGVE